MNWTDVDNYTISASLPIDDIGQIENYCRRVSFTEWNGPSCVTIDQAEMVRLEQCNVPYCGICLFTNLNVISLIVTFTIRGSSNNLRTTTQKMCTYVNLQA